MTGSGRALGRALALAAVLAATGCGPRTELTLRFIGHEAVELSDGRESVLVDFPYASGAGGTMTFIPGKVRPHGRVLALFTHRHRDHFDREALLSRGWPAYGPPDLLALLPADRVYARTDSLAFGAFHIVAVPEEHADVGHVAYLVTWHGRRIYHSGDTMDPARLQATAELDVALVQENLLCWMAQQRGARVPARKVVVIHRLGGGGRECLGAEALPQGGEVRLAPLD